MTVGKYRSAKPGAAECAPARPSQSAGERFNTAGKGRSRLRSERSLQETCVKDRPGIGQFKVHLDAEEVFKLFTRQHGLAALAPHRLGSDWPPRSGADRAAAHRVQRAKFSLRGRSKPCSR